MKIRHLVGATVLLAGCASSPVVLPELRPRGPSSDAAFLPPLNNGHAWKADDPLLARGELTIWELQKMADAGQFTELNQLYDHGLNMDSIPRGFAAGAGARILGINALVGFTGDNWRGKIFDNSNDPMNTTGRNRIRATLLLPTSHIVPMAQFVSHVVPNSPLVTTTTSNLVVLNYAHPVTELHSEQELLLQTVAQVYDVMVAVPGKYGPLYIGKTWLGHYDGQDEFHPLPDGHLVAWYFLDFNEAALAEQRANHWPGGHWDVDPSSIRNAK